jgi:hypothetical protein
LGDGLPGLQARVVLHLRAKRFEAKAHPFLPLLQGSEDPCSLRKNKQKPWLQLFHSKNGRSIKMRLPCSLGRTPAKARNPIPPEDGVGFFRSLFSRAASKPVGERG